MDRYDQLQKELGEALHSVHSAALSSRQAEMDYAQNKYTFILIRRQVKTLQRELSRLDQQAQRGLRLNGIGSCREAWEANREYDKEMN